MMDSRPKAKMATLSFLTTWLFAISTIDFAVSVQEIPRFLVQPSDTNVVENDVAIIACSTTGIPAPTVVSWLKNGQQLQLVGTKSIIPPGNLRLAFVSRSDDGYYQCVARNSIASVISRWAKLNVAYFDMVVSQLQYRSKNAGSSYIEIGPSISINQFPKPVYTWKKDGVTLVEDGRISVSKQHTLYIADLKSSDGGTYTCVVENPIMKSAAKVNAVQTAKRVRLTVTGAVPSYSGVSLLKNPGATTAYQGKDPSVHMECFPNRSDTTITWTKNGVVLSSSAKYRFDSTRKRLTIFDLQKTDEASYSCESSYLRHRVSGSGQLTVIVPPGFLTSEMVTNAFSDNSTYIWCNATVLSQLKWFHNGKRLYPSGSRVIIFGNGTLFINHLSWRDSGVYQCTVENAAGHAMALTRLNVLNITARIAVPLRDSYFHVGSTAVVPCYVTGAPKPTIRWLRSGQAIPPTMTRFSTTSQGYLQIINSLKTDSGFFTCIANNGGGDAQTTAYVGIVEPTLITKGPNATTIAQKAVTILLPCQVSHDPTVNVTWEWRKNTGKLNDARYTVLNDGTLQIVSTQEIDAATFSCNVYSNGGNGSVSTVLQIVSLPFSPSTPTASEIRTNSLRLTWLAPEYNGGIPLKDYELQIKNETANTFKSLLFTTQLSVEVKNLLAGVKYSFRVGARNELGTGRWSPQTPFIQMKIEAPSRAPTNVRAMSTQQTKITLRWTPPPVEYHNGKLKGYNVYYRVQGYTNSAFTIRVAPPGLLTDAEITYVLDNLLTFTFYEIKVAAFNDAGVGVQSRLLIAETKPGIPSVAPTGVSIEVVNATAALVSYHAPKQIHWNGQLISSRGFAYESERPLDPYVYDATYNHATRYNQSFIMMGLKPNTQYALRVAVVTASGAGPKSDAVYFRMQEGSPGSPRNFMVTATYAHSILLRWSPPYEKNGVLLGYKVGHRVYQFGRGTWIPRSQPEPPESGGAVFRHLQLNTKYEFYVLAYTSAGDGPRVFIDAQTRQTAPTLPGKPSKPILVENNGTSITLSWIMGETGGTLMSYYLIEANNQSNYKNLPEVYRDWYLAVNLTRIQDIPTRIKNLTTNTVYRFRVTPINSVGRGPTSNISEDILTAESKPSVGPTNLQVTAHDRQGLLIQWIPPPKHTWGSGTIFYKIKLVSIGKRDRDERIVHQRDSQSRQYIAVGLAKWTQFNVTVTVYNSVGNGPTTWPVTGRTAEDVPDNGPATIKVSVVSSSVANVSWTPVPPEIRNGIILGYFVYYNIKTEQLVVHRKVIIGGDTYLTVLTGLAGYARYEVRISAYTKSGEGKKTDPVEFVTPDGVAGKPYQVRFPTVRTDFVRVTWKPPLRPNGAIVSYEVQHKVKDSKDDFAVVAQPRSGPDVRSADVSGLIGNRYYIFRVYAKTRLGRGIPAEELVFTSPNRQVPESPVVLPIILSDVDSTSVLVKWKPRYDGMSPIRSYTLQYNKIPDGWKDYLSNVTGRVDIDASVTSLLVTRLLPSSSYSFRVKATNDVGDSGWSAASKAVLTHPDAPKGAPKNLRIKAHSPISLKVEWEAPSFEDLGGLPVQFLLRYRELGTSQWSSNRQLPKTPLYALIQNLKGFTAYEVSMAAKNDRGTGPWAQKTGVTGESVPVGVPSNVIVTAEDSTTIKVRWTPPAAWTIRGNLLGYKIEYRKLGVSSRRKRRRRSTKSICPVPEKPLKVKIAGPYVQEETIRGAEKNSRYEITVRVYNGAGDGPKSQIRYINTPEGTPSPPVILWSKSYINDIDIQWREPCSPNGRITAYEVQYWEIGTTEVNKRQFKENRFTDRISGLKPLTNYRIQLRAATRSGFGESAFLTLKTISGIPALPEQPGKPEVLSTSATTANLQWKEGDNGNVPIIKYRIQYAKSDSNWKTGWEVYFDKWGRDGNKIFYTINNLEPETTYSFRVIAVNKMGASLASDATVPLKTGKKTEKPFHSELWFILLIIVVALLIVALLVLFICIRRRKQKGSKYHDDITPKDRQLQQQTNDLRKLQTRPRSEFISAYGYEQVEKAVEEEEVKETKRPKSELLLPKDIESKLQSGHTGTMRDRKNRLEKLDLQPVAVEVPKVPDDVLAVRERRAPEGEEGKRIEKDGVYSPLKNVPLGSHDETRFSGSDYAIVTSSVAYSSDSDRKSSASSIEKCPPVIRRHPRRNANAQIPGRRRSTGGVPGQTETPHTVSQSKSFVNQSFDDQQDPIVELPLSRSASRRSLRSENVLSDNVMSSFCATPKSAHRNLEQKGDDKGPSRRSPNLLDEIKTRRQSLRRCKRPSLSSSSSSSLEEDEARAHYSHNVSIESGKSISKREPRENVSKAAAKDTKQRSKSHGSLDSVLSNRCNEYEDVFIEQEKVDVWRSQESLNNQRCRKGGYDDHGGNRESRMSGGKSEQRTNLRRSTEEMSDTRSERKSYRRSGQWSGEKSGEKSGGKLGMESCNKSGRRPNQKSDGWSSERRDRKSHRRPDDIQGRQSQVSGYSPGRKSGTRSDKRFNGSSDVKSDRVSYRSHREDSDYDEKWDIDIDDVREPVRRMRVKSRDDEHDVEYGELVRNLTRGRARTSYDHEIDRKHFANETRERSRSRRGEVNTNDNAPMSSFELAMVRNKGGSAQRLINSDTESRSGKSVASKKSRTTVDRKSTKDVVDERTNSSISKHSEPSDGEADKSNQESEDEGKFVRGGPVAGSIASHYANDPFYKNWRSSLDKKTRKAILTEYHDRHKKGAAAARQSVESVGSSRPYRSTSEEGLDRINARRPRPGRADLSEKRKLAQSDPYLNQEPAPSVSSFTPSGEGERPAVRRPGKRPMDRAAARSEPSLNVNDSDSDGNFPPPYEDENARRRKNSFLRATKGSHQSLRKGSVDNLDDASRAKQDLAAELDRAANYYARAPPPYEESDDYDVDIRSPPAYTPWQDGVDESRPGNRGKRNWRPQRQQNGRDYRSQSSYDSRNDVELDDDVDGPSRTSMTLV